MTLDTPPTGLGGHPADSSPAVSVVIPTYNRVDTLPRAVASVISQSFSNWELIVVDDASSDDTPSYLDSLDDPRIRAIRQPFNLGGSAARNVGIKAAVGQFIAFLDSDDEWLNTKLERQVQAMADPNTGVVYSGYLERHSEGMRQVRAREPSDSMFEHIIGLRGVSKTSAILVRRTMLDATRVFFDETLPAHQEWDFMCRLAAQLTFKAVSEPLFILDRTPRTDRVGASINKVKAAELILTKYQRELSQRPTAAATHHFQGALHYASMGDALGARRHLAAAIRLAPQRRAWRILYLGSFLGDRLLKALTVLYRTPSRLRKRPFDSDAIGRQEESSRLHTPDTGQ